MADIIVGFNNNLAADVIQKTTVARPITYLPPCHIMTTQKLCRLSISKDNPATLTANRPLSGRPRLSIPPDSTRSIGLLARHLCRQTHRAQHLPEPRHRGVRPVSAPIQRRGRQARRYGCGVRVDGSTLRHGSILHTQGINGVTFASAFRSPLFGQNYGVMMTDGPLAGLLARAVMIIDKTEK